MDGGYTTDVDSGADDSRDVVTIPLLLEFDEPETTMEPLIADNALPEAELELGPQEEPAQEVLTATPSAGPPVANAIAVRLGSGADDNPSASAAEDDSEAENMDRCGRRGSRRNRSRRSRSRCSRSRSRRNRSRSRRNRSRSWSRHGRSCSARSGNDDSEMSVVVEIADERSVGSNRGGCGRKADKTTASGRRGVTKTVAARGIGADKKQAPRGARKSSSKRGRRGRKTTGGESARRTIWTDRLRSRKTRHDRKRCDRNNKIRRPFAGPVTT